MRCKNWIPVEIQLVGSEPIPEKTIDGASIWLSDHYGLKYKVIFVDS
jgi:hypothetical protein